MGAKKSRLPRRLADELLEGLGELTRWARGEKTGVRSYTLEVAPAAGTVRRTRIRLPGGGVASITFPVGPAEEDRLAVRRRVARIRRAVLKAVADD